MTIQELYLKALDRGVLGTGTTEEQFRNTINTDDGLKTFYNDAISKGMRFHEYDVFKSRIGWDKEFNKGVVEDKKSTTSPLVYKTAGEKTEYDPLLTNRETKTTTQTNPIGANASTQPKEEAPAKSGFEIATEWRNKTTQLPPIAQQMQNEVIKRDEELNAMSLDQLKAIEQQIIAQAEKVKQEQIAKQKEWDKQNPAMSAMVTQSNGGKSAVATLEETPAEMFVTNKAYYDKISKLLGAKWNSEGFTAERAEADAVKSYVDELSGKEGLSSDAEANLKSARYLNTKTDEILNAGSKYDSSNGFKNWFEGLKDNIDRDLIGAVGWVRSKRIDDIVQKLNNGNELSEDEAALIASQMTYSMAQYARHFDLSVGYKIGQISSQSLPYIIDMFVTRGLNAAGAKLLLKGLKLAKFSKVDDVARILVGGKGIKIGDEVLGVAKSGGREFAKDMLLYTPVQTAVMPSSWDMMQESATQMRFDKNADVVVNDGKVGIEWTPQSNEIGLWDRAKIFGDQYWQNFTERKGGEFIDAGLTKVIPFEKVWKGAGARQLANSYIQSPVGETFEEYLAAVINYGRSYIHPEHGKELRQDAEYMFSKEGLGVTFGSVLPMSLVGGIVNTAEITYASNQYSKTRKAMVDKLVQSGYNEEQAEGIISNIERAEDVNQMNQYANELKTLFVTSGLEQQRDKDGRKTQSGIDVEDYLDAAVKYEMAVRDLDGKLKELTPEQQAQAKQEMQEFADKVKADRRQAIVQSEAQRLTDERKNDTTGTIIKVTMNDGSLEEGSEAYVVGGVINTYDDEKGNTLIDRDNSDDMVWVRTIKPDGTSETKNVSTQELDLTDKPITAEEFNATAAEYYNAALQEIESATSQSAEGEGATAKGKVYSNGQQTITASLPDADGVVTLSSPIEIDGDVVTQAPQDIVDAYMADHGFATQPTQSAGSPYPVDGNNNPMWSSMDAKQSLDALMHILEQDKETAKEFANIQLERAKAELGEALKRKPQATSDIAAFKAEKAAIKAEQERLQAEVDRWSAVANGIDAYNAPVQTDSDNGVVTEGTARQSTTNAQQSANNSQNTLQSENNSVPLQRQKVQEYIDSIKSEGNEVKVWNEDNVEEVLRENGVGERVIAIVIARLDQAKKEGDRMNGFIIGNTLFLNYNTANLDDVRTGYVHERQHGLTTEAQKDSVKKSASKEQLVDIVMSLSGSTSYSKDDIDTLADEYISMAMEVAYSVDTDAELERALSNAGANEELINIIKGINNEQRKSNDLSRARRNSILNDNQQESGQKDGRDSESVSRRVLEQEGDGSPRSSTRGDKSGRPSESSEVGQDTSLEESGIQVNDETGDARFSVNYRLDANQMDILAEQIAERVGVSKAKAKKWLKAETSLAALCMQEDNVAALYYFADGRYGAIKNNSDYPQGTVDFNNICRKRLDFTNIYLSLQREFPNKVFTAKDLETIRQIMIEDGLEVACGLCYVEDRRQLLGEIANEFRGFLKDRVIPEDLSATKKEVMQKVLDMVGDDTYIPTIAQLLEAGAYELRNSHPNIFEAFVVFNNSRGMQSGRLFEGYAEYKREILDWSDKKVKQVNDAGGLRIFSFSDFEAHHLIDIVQIISDAASKGVMIQGYTKVPEFARAIRNTKVKLNRSLIPLGDTGIQEVDGKKVLAYDTTEGIDVNNENFLDESNNPNVGNVLVGINDEQIRMAMEDTNVDYIIPFHTGLKKDILLQKKIGAWVNYKNSQTEKDATTGSSKTADGKKVVGVNIYTDVLQAAEKEGASIKNRKEFVEYFLKVCKERGLVPRFEQFLARGKNGEYKYTKGYEKLLVDFKMFDKRGNILPQEPVVPIFDDAFNQQIIENYVKGTKETKEYESTKDKIRKGINLVQFSIGNNSNTDYLNSKQEKDGQDIVGSIDSANPLFSVSNNTRKIVDGWLNKRNDLTEQEKSAFYTYIENEEPMKQLAMGKWMANGAIRLPEDQLTVDEAIKFAKKMKVDPLSYAAPAMISNEYRERFGKAEEKAQDQLLSPDDARFEGKLTNKVDYGNGLVVYDVLDNEEGQDAVRELMNDHFGKDFNCWCLLYANAEGKITSQARDTYWQKYNGTQKKVAFYNGKITAFCASEEKTSEWWDLSDRSHKGNIPAYVPMPNDEYNRMVEAEFSEKDGQLEGYGKIFRGNKKNGVYETWYNEDYHSLESREHFKGGKADGTSEGWHKDGSRMYKGTFKEGKGLGKYTAWNTDGSVYLDMEYDDRGSVALSRTYYDGGVKATEYGVGLPSLEWDKQGRLVALEYKHKNSAAKESYSVYVDLDPKSGRITSLDYEEGFEIKLSYREGGLFSDRKRKEALNSLKKSSQEMYDVVVKAANGEMNQSIDDLATSESQVRFSVVTDKKLLNELENGETIKVYRAMQLQDGKLYPPMSGKVEGEWRNPIELGVWEQSEERPDLAVEKKRKDGSVSYVFELNKGNKKTVPAAYNPYIHTSTTPLNDQFSSAQDRPELVTVEVEVPASELTSGYKAEKAKDAVGEVDWKAGVVQGQLTGTRKVILSRYDKPIRIVPDAEVAERIVEMIDGRDIVFPSNVVTPQLREELEKRGVQFKETDNQGKPRFSISNIAEDAWNKYQYDGELESIRDVANYIEENMPKNEQTQALFDAIDAYNEEEFEDRQYYGMRGDLEPFEDAILEELETLMNSKPRFSVTFASVNEELNADGISIDNDVLMEEYGLSSIELSKKDNYINLGKIVVADKGKGNGSRFMQDLTEYADANGYTLTLTPDTSYGASSVARLKKFYKEFGFKDNKGRNTDYNVWESMLRSPKSPRFSITAAEDKAYADAVARGDMATAQRMVIEAAKKAMPNTKIVDADGNPMIVYHDTNATELVNIETGENWNDLDWRAKDEWRNREDFDDYWEERDFYTFNNLRSRRSIEMPAYFFSAKEDEYHEYGDRTIRAFLNITNPAMDPTIENAGTYDYAGEDAMNKLIEQGHDGFIRTIDNGEWDEVNAFYPNQIKSADPVTYDDNGNVIPLSERFNSDESDIRFSVSAANEGRLLNEEEKLIAKQQLLNTTPEECEQGVIKEQGKKKARQVAEEWVDKNMPTPLKYNTDAGEVIIDKTSIQNSLAHRYSQRKLDAITTLPKGFKKAVHLGSLKDFSRPETTNHYFAYPIIYNDELCYVFCRARQDVNTNRLYVHEVFVADNIKESNALQTAAKLLHSKPHGGIALYKYILADVLSADKGTKNIPNNQINSQENADLGKNISFSVSNTNQRIFVSNAERAVESIKQEKATPQQWKAMIEKQGGLKAGEDKWLGLSEWLDSKVVPEQKGETMGEAARRVAKSTITKQEILDYIAEHQIQIEEVEYAEGSPFEGDLTMEQEGNFNSFILEWGDIITSEGVSEEEAFETMVDRYGEDFRMAFELDESNEFTYIVDYDGSLSDAAQYFLGKDNSNQINDVRLQYTTKGLENKHEIALTVPTIESWNESDEIHFGDAGEGRAIAWVRFGETEMQTPREVIDHVDELQFAYTNANGQDVYAPQGSKFSKDYAVYGKLANGEMGYVLYVRNNQLSAHPTLEAALEALNAHYEANPRQVTDYDTVLVIDEIQSKRHQEGREKGYATKKDRDIKKKIAELTNQQDAIFDAMRAREEGRAGITNFTEEETAELKRLGEEIKQLQSELSANNGIIPDAPFDKNWHELAFKRMLRYAAENGFDYVAWTTGAQQAERYDIGSEINVIDAYRDDIDDDIMDVNIYTTKQHRIRLDVSRTTGKVVYVADMYKEFMDKPLSELIGKDLANDIIKSEYNQHRYEGDGLRIGGEGMKGFYDKMLPSFVSKYTKKWGAKVQDINLPQLEESAQTMHAVNVTQEMKDSVAEGQVMFSVGNTPKPEDNQNLLIDAPTPEPNETARDYVNRFREWRDSQLRVSAVKEYKNELKKQTGAWRQFVKKIIDRNMAIEKFQDFVLKHGGKIDMSSNAFLDTCMAIGRAGSATDRYKTRYLQPMWDAVAELVKQGRRRNLGIVWKNIEGKNNGKPLSISDIIGVYCQAKDVIEAEQLGLPDRGREGFTNNLATRSDEEVTPEYIVQLVESRFDTTKLWKAINDATMFSLIYQRRHKFIDRTTFDAYKSRKYYVPERGWRERDMEERSRKYVDNNGNEGSIGSPFNSALMKAKGRTSLASDPFAYIESIGMSTIAAVEKNNVKQKFLKFVLDNDKIGRESGAWKIKTIYKVKADNANGYEITYTKPANEEDIIGKIGNNLETLKELAAKEKKQHAVSVIQDGQEYVILLEDEQVANALNRNYAGINFQNTMVGRITRGTTGYFSAQLTQYNPEFAATNFIKDFFSANLSNLAVQERPLAHTLRFNKNIAQAMPELALYVGANTVGRTAFLNTPRGKYMQEYFRLGAQTGFSYLEDVTALRDKYNDFVNKRKALKAVGAIPKFLSVDLLASLSELSELSVRMAQYITCREMGMSAKQAAVEAKEITVNFDRKGELSSVFSGLWSFFNATIQGTNKIARDIKRNPVRASLVYSAFAGILFTLGYLWTKMNPDDPEEEEMWSDYARQTAITVGEWKVPMMPFFRMFWGGGTTVALKEQGRMTDTQAAWDLTRIAMDEIIPTSPFQVHNLFEYNPEADQVEGSVENYLRNLVPSGATPAVDVLTNEDFMGRSISKEPFRSSDKDVYKAKKYERTKKTPEAYVKAADWLSGGNPEQLLKGKESSRIEGVDVVDINGTQLQHLVEGYTKQFSIYFDIWSLAEKAINDEGIKTADIPFLRKFRKEYLNDNAYASEYWKLKGKVDRYSTELKEAGKIAPEEVVKMMYKKPAAEGETPEFTDKYMAYLEAAPLVNEAFAPNDSIHPSKEQVRQLVEMNNLWNKLR